MKLPFLYEHLKNKSLDNRKELLESLTTHDWTIKAIHTFPTVNDGHSVVALDSNKGYWLNNIPLDLFSKECLVEEIINNTQFNKI